jgi:hypothetical protein
MVAKGRRSRPKKGGRTTVAKKFADRRETGDNTDTPEGLAGATLKHRFHEKLRVQNSITFFQNITDRAEYRFIFDSTRSVDVTKRVGVFITLGNRFNNDPLGTSKRNDVLSTTGMKWNFDKKR